jgi:hypothetical protein
LNLDLQVEGQSKSLQWPIILEHGRPSAKNWIINQQQITNIKSKQIKSILYCLRSCLIMGLGAFVLALKK